MVVTEFTLCVFQKLSRIVYEGDLCYLSTSLTLKAQMLFKILAIQFNIKFATLSSVLVHNLLGV